MTALATSLAKGRFTAGQLDVTTTSRVRHQGRPVVYCHGAGGDAAEAVGWSSAPSVRTMLAGIAQGYTPIVVPTQTNQWGNSVSVARIDAALAYARSNLGATDDPPILIGASHGAACALTYALNHEVVAVVVVIPAVDLEFIRSADQWGLRASVDAAWGVTYPTPLPVGANPVDNDPQVPTQIWWATDDPTSTGIESYASAVGADINSVGALGHTDAAIAAVDTHSVVSFIGGVTQ